MWYAPTIHDVLTALSRLANIPRPYGDNEGDPINGSSVYPYLSVDHQNQVDTAESLLRQYTRAPGGGVNNRALAILRRHGVEIYLGPYQYDFEKTVGSATTGDWTIDLSDDFDD